ncbi:hypothetical protein T310_6007 [Rasamsonia emersonii CBS 393.64]|uniref:non-specific serine/threonine protein kinase n=1 Tax=Rasamsonia emersonii (strain ATCC 16479 / CBS 393.64 / IMI 116815) TaxID=1408163 RepID=A0A0F4YP36_RASE3|nr:hypothetical protein T310_6007 [Rasamsonia emersonii CBS 393.64]KKA20009.1 hypothetical protein T310_6007 [Rasamsonia emersonii CBS 393.64]
MSSIGSQSSSAGIYRVVYPSLLTDSKGQSLSSEPRKLDAFWVMRDRLLVSFHPRRLSSTFVSPHFPSVASRLTRNLPWFFSRAPRPFTALSGDMEPPGSGEAHDVGFKVEYIPLEGVERLERYRPGGYHPVVIGGCLHDRYRIVHKLGFGAYSTTWLARDQTAGRFDFNTLFQRVIKSRSASDVKRIFYNIKKKVPTQQLLCSRYIPLFRGTFPSIWISTKLIFLSELEVFVCHNSDVVRYSAKQSFEEI